MSEDLEADSQYTVYINDNEPNATVEIDQVMDIEWDTLETDNVYILHVISTRFMQEVSQ